MTILATTRTRYQAGAIFQPQTKAWVYEKNHKLIFISSNLYFCIKNLRNKPEHNGKDKTNYFDKPQEHVSYKLVGGGKCGSRKFRFVYG